MFDSIPDVVDVRVHRGPDADADAPPTVFIELPHGATRAHHYHDLRAQLHGPFPENLEHFFFVNTDVGSPECGAALAEAVVAARPDAVVLTLCCQIPRTFIDCNRVIKDAPPQTSPTDITPGLPPYIRNPQDEALLLDRYAAYQRLAAKAFAATYANDGLAVMLHTFAPRSVGVQVDDDIVTSLHAAYAPDVFSTWPQRPAVDIICKAPEGEMYAPLKLIEDLVDRFSAIDVQATLSQTYPLHPASTAAHRAMAHPNNSLCIEFRRDLLVTPFTPFQEMIPARERVQRMTAPLADAVIAWLP
ncbi:MAG: hypothetical protein AAFV53_03900 [Myxococcota bacterium]